MNADRREHRQSYFDMQTFHIHYPIRNRGRMRVLPKPKMGHFPVALIPQQFVDYYRAFTPKQLSYMPLNTTLMGPPDAGAKMVDLDPGSGGDDVADSSSSDDDSSSGSSSSGSDSDSSSESSSSDEEEVEEVPKKVAFVEPEKPRKKIGNPSIGQMRPL